VLKPLSDRYLVIETMLFMRRDQRYGRAKDFVDDLLSRLLAGNRRPSNLNPQTMALLICAKSTDDINSCGGIIPTGALKLAFSRAASSDGLDHCFTEGYERVILDGFGRFRTARHQRGFGRNLLGRALMKPLPRWIMAS